MNGKVSIKNLESYGDSGWTWTEEVTNAAGTEKRNCSTNQQGDGLWYDDKQVSGTCQFQLPRKRQAAYAKIRREALKELEG